MKVPVVVLDVGMASVCCWLQAQDAIRNQFCSTNPPPRLQSDSGGM